VDDLSVDNAGVDPALEVLQQTERRPLYYTTSTRKKRRVIVAGYSLLKGTEGPICREDPPHREFCCLPEAWMRDTTRKLPSLVQPSDY